MTVIRLQDGKAIVEDGRVGIADACCCEANCCECDSLFSFYANTRPLSTFEQVRELGNLFARVPGLGFDDGLWTNGGCVTEQQCDDEGNLIARINIFQFGQYILTRVDGFTATYVLGLVIESRYYRFDLDEGGCGIIQGEAIALPEGASTAASALLSCSNSFGSSEEVGVIDGDVIRFVPLINLSDGGDGPVDSSPLNLDWGSITIHASCQIHCGLDFILGATDFELTSCEEANLDCGDCICQPAEIGSTDPIFLGNSYFQCAINPLP